MVEMCPPRYLPPNGGAKDSINGMRYSFVPNVPHITMWNDKIAPIGYANGGMVDESHINIPDGVLHKDDPDKVFARLMPGELIVPKRIVPYVTKMLKKKGIKLNGME